MEVPLEKGQGQIRLPPEHHCRHLLHSDSSRRRGVRMLPPMRARGRKQHTGKGVLATACDEVGAVEARAVTGVEEEGRELTLRLHLATLASERGLYCFYVSGCSAVLSPASSHFPCVCAVVKGVALVSSSSFFLFRLLLSVLPVCVVVFSDSASSSLEGSIKRTHEERAR